MWQISCEVDTSNKMVHKPMIMLTGNREFNDLQKAKNVRQILQCASELAKLDDVMSFEIYTIENDHVGELVVNSAGQDV